MAAKIEFGKTPSDELPVSLTIESAEIGMLDELYMTERLLGLFVDDVDNWDIWLEGAGYDYTLRYFKDKSLQNCCVRIWEGLSDEELVRATVKAQARLRELAEERMPQEQCKIVDEAMNIVHREAKSWRETIQVGDLVDVDESCYAVDGRNIRYAAKDKLYEVVRLEHWAENSVTARCVGDCPLPGQAEPATFGVHDSRVIVRNGKVIWESSDHLFGRYAIANEAKIRPHCDDWRWANLLDGVLQLEGVEFPPARNPYAEEETEGSACIDG